MQLPLHSLVTHLYFDTGTDTDTSRIGIVGREFDDDGRNSGENSGKTETENDQAEIHGPNRGVSHRCGEQMLGRLCK